MFAVVFIALSTAFESPLSQELISNSKCSHAQVQNALYCNTSIFDIIEDTPQDMTNVVYVYMALIVLAFLYMVVLFKPRYKRAESDKNGEVRIKQRLPSV